MQLFKVKTKVGKHKKKAPKKKKKGIPSKWTPLNSELAKIDVPSLRSKRNPPLHALIWRVFHTRSSKRKGLRKRQNNIAKASVSDEILRTASRNYLCTIKWGRLRPRAAIRYIHAFWVLALSRPNQLTCLIPFLVLSWPLWNSATSARMRNHLDLGNKSKVLGAPFCA